MRWDMQLNIQHILNDNSYFSYNNIHKKILTSKSTYPKPLLMPVALSRTIRTADIVPQSLK